MYPDGFTTTNEKHWNHITVSWIKPNLTTFPGDLIGYQLLYRMIQRALTRINQPKTQQVIIHPAENSYTFKSDPGSIYEVELALINEIGTGKLDAKSACMLIFFYVSIPSY